MVKKYYDYILFIFCLTHFYYACIQKSSDLRALGEEGAKNFLSEKYKYTQVDIFACAVYC